MRRVHATPLPDQAIAILKALHPLTDRGESSFISPSTTSSKIPISENTTTIALRRLGFGQDQMTSHGFRAAFATLANESGKWSVDAIERQLAHMEGSAVRRAYARGQYWDERVAMMQWWADYLDQLREGAKIISFQDKRKTKRR
ncbi:tyrosine-type recombinase/integrase [Ectorhizobium quercum]|uniref:tyrosine-type recombinase/integrase n=1 Tax=Ectorhizobium quercum TaxID=2965071 RepID=UPI0027955B34|nr:site-specific integrase [Ectorhizobium quercum]